MPWNQNQTGDQDLQEVYPRLRRIANEILSQERRRSTLQGTELVHEALMRLRGYRGLIAGSSHYVSLMVGAMRRILIDRGRRRQSQKRTPAEGMATQVEPESERLMAVRHAFDRLRRHDGELSEVMRLYFFDGLTLEETAAQRKVSVARVRQLLAFGEAWIAHELGPK